MVNRWSVLYVLLSISVILGVLTIGLMATDLSRPIDSGPRYIFEQIVIYYLVFSVVRTVIMLVLSFADYYYRPRRKFPKNFPLITVLVPCFNEERVIESAIQSISKINYPNLEILVIDDGSRDETLLLATRLERYGRLRVVHQENAGKAMALNRGISEANGDFIFCMDADSHLEPNALLYGVSYFEKNSKLSAVAGNVKVGNKDTYLTVFQRLEYIIGLNFYKTAQSFLGMVTIVPGPVGLFRKSSLEQIGGYHHDTFAEDCDLTIRLLMKGGQVSYCPEMVAHTEVPEDINSLISQRYRWSRGIVQAIMKNAEWIFRPFQSFRNFAILIYMGLESIVIPLANFVFAVVTIELCLLTDPTAFLGFFFLGLTMLDLVLTAYSVWEEKAPVKLIFVALVNRLTYGLSLELVRFLSILDQLFVIPMGWGKLKRKGM